MILRAARTMQIALYQGSATSHANVTGAEFGSATNRRQEVDLTGRVRARINGVGGGVDGVGVARVEYSVDAGSSWSTLCETDDLVAMSSTIIGEWTTIPVAARRNVLIRMFVTGNGVADPSFGHWAMEVQ